MDAGPMMIVSRPWPASTLSVLIHATVEPMLSAMSTTTNLSASVLKVTLETPKLDVSKVGVFFLHFNEIRLENYSLFESFSKSIFASLFLAVPALFIEN